MRKVFLALALTLSLLTLGAPLAVANETPCVGGLPPGMYEDIVVPPGANCDINGATVSGNIKALENSQLVVTSSTVRGNVEGDKADLVQVNFSTVTLPLVPPVVEVRPVHGNITIKEGGPAHAPYPAGALGCFGDSQPCEVQMLNTTVRNGNVQVEKMGVEGAGAGVNLAIQQSTIEKGNVKFEDNLLGPGGLLFIVQNTIGGNLQVFKNRGPGQKYVSGNIVRGAVQCKENDPPFVAGASPFAGANTGNPVECSSTP